MFTTYKKYGKKNSYFPSSLRQEPYWDQPQNMECEDRWSQSQFLRNRNFSHFRRHTRGVDLLAP